MRNREILRSAESGQEEIPDEQLVQMIMQGNQQAANELVLRYRKYLGIVINERLIKNSNLRRRVDPDDVSQETWKRFFQWIRRTNRKNFEGDNPIRRLLLAIVRGLLTDLYRQNTAGKRNVDQEIQLPPQYDPPLLSDPSADLILTELKQQILDGTKSKKFKLVIEAVLKDRSSTLIDHAMDLNIAEKTAYRAMEYAENAIKKILESER